MSRWKNEIRRNPSDERRFESEALISLASTRLEMDINLVERAKELGAVGYGPYDPLHLAAAEAAKVDTLLSTDDRFVKVAARRIGNPLVRVRDPVFCIKEQEK